MVIFSELTNKIGNFNKQVNVNSDGEVSIDSAANVVSASAVTKKVDVEDIASYIDSLKNRHDTALVLGIWRNGFEDWDEYDIEVGTSGQVDPDKGVIARTKEFFQYANNDSTSLMYLDFDGTHSDRDRNTFLKELDIILSDALIGELGHERDTICKWKRPSSSASAKINGEVGNGLHVYMAVKNANEELIKLIHRFCWLQEYGKGFKMTAAGTILPESLIDPAVGSPERVVYSADITCNGGNGDARVFEKVIRKCDYIPGGVIDCEIATQILKDVTIEYDREWRAYKNQIERSDEVRAARKEWKDEQIAKKVKAGYSKKDAKSAIKSLANGILLSNEMLLRNDGSEVSVKDVLLDPDEWLGVNKFCDPIKKEVHRNVGMIMGTEENMFLNSKNHGGVKYWLKWNYEDLTVWAETCDEDELDDWFTIHVANCDMRDSQLNVLSKIIGKRIGASAGAVTSDIKTAVKEQIEESVSVDAEEGASCGGALTFLDAKATHGDIIEDYIARAGDCRTFGDGFYVWQDGTIWQCQNSGTIQKKVRNDYNHVTRCSKVSDYKALSGAIITEEDINVERWEEEIGFPCSDGFYKVDADGIERVEYTKELGCRFKMGIKPSSMATPMFDRIVDNVDNPVLFQQLFGLAICAKLPVLQKAFIMFGDGGAGKGTCSDIMAAMLPKNRMTSMSLDQLNDEKYRVQLADSRINFTSEVSRKRLNLTGVKEALGGGLITGRALFQGPVQFYPNCTFIVSMNHFFPLGETGTAVQRRFGDSIVKFTKKHGSQIEGLAAIVIENELPGVLAWAMEGVRMWLDIGLESSLSNELYVKWMSSVDDISLFIEENIDIVGRVTSANIKRSDMWNRYKKFCEDSGYYTCRKGELFAKLDTYPHFQKVGKHAGEVVYKFVRWK